MTSAALFEPHRTYCERGDPRVPSVCPSHKSTLSPQRLAVNIRVERAGAGQPGGRTMQPMHKNRRFLGMCLAAAGLATTHYAAEATPSRAKGPPPVARLGGAQEPAPASPRPVVASMVEPGRREPVRIPTRTEEEAPNHAPRRPGVAAGRGGDHRRTPPWSPPADGGLAAAIEPGAPPRSHTPSGTCPGAGARAKWLAMTPGYPRGEGNVYAWL